MIDWTRRSLDNSRLMALQRSVLPSPPSGAVSIGFLPERFVLGGGRESGSGSPWRVGFWTAGAGMYVGGGGGSVSFADGWLLASRILPWTRRTVAPIDIPTSRESTSPCKRKLRNGVWPSIQARMYALERYSLLSPPSRIAMTTNCPNIIR